jgi:epoxide hydrolase-like predicted phosphatase
VGIRAVFFDLGGVLVRTEYEAPRQHLAERLGMEYDDLVRLVFESETSRMASVGKVSMLEHFEAVARKLKRDPSEAQAIHDEFFAGDVTDRVLVDFIRSLKPHYKTGLISNAWGDLRSYMTAQGFADAFDHLIISAEVGVVKPKPEIYHLALKQLEVSPSEAVFVDDFIENVEGARAVAMSAIHFKDAGETIAQVKKLLKR